jgi:hypothetical protein
MFFELLGRTAPLLLLFLVGLLPQCGMAFTVADHRALTEAALDSARSEAPPRPLLEAYRGAVVHGAMDEDRNLHVKWTGWHHFYNPEGSLDTAVRHDSAARVQALRACRGPRAVGPKGSRCSSASEWPGATAEWK